MESTALPPDADLIAAFAIVALVVILVDIMRHLNNKDREG